MAARLSARHVVVERGLGTGEKSDPGLSLSHFVFLKVVLGSGQVAFPEGVGEKRCLTSSWTIA